MHQPIQVKEWRKIPAMGGSKVFSQIIDNL